MSPWPGAIVVAIVVLTAIACLYRPTQRALVYYRLGRGLMRANGHNEAACRMDIKRIARHVELVREMARKQARAVRTVSYEQEAGRARRASDTKLQ